MGKLSGKTAIVTGAAKGIGRGIAEAFANEGADVAIADIATSEQAQPALEAIRQAGRNALFIHTDVANEQQVRAMVDAVLEAFGHIDILVNNAGIFTQGLVEDLPVADWDRVVNVNLRGTFLCTHFVLPHLLKQGGGRIINIASQLGYIGGVEVAHYCASKGGVIAFTKALAREVATRNVLVNGIAPGPILTD
ncbi:MAG TPA: SDR family NAD(P)-dependent oxidoreductase, partial [Ktedonobacteraceae bacterium]